MASQERKVWENVDSTHLEGDWLWLKQWSSWDSCKDTVKLMCWYRTQFLMELSLYKLLFTTTNGLVFYRTTTLIKWDIDSFVQRNQQNSGLHSHIILYYYKTGWRAGLGDLVCKVGLDYLYICLYCDKIRRASIKSRFRAAVLMMMFCEQRRRPRTSHTDDENYCLENGSHGQVYVENSRITQPGSFQSTLRSGKGLPGRTRK